MFRVGMKVVCVDVFEPHGLSLGTLKLGEIYTIREILISEDETRVKLAEIFRPCGKDRAPIDTPYKARRFRPVVERKTDISIFKQILRDVTARENVRA